MSPSARLLSNAICIAAPAIGSFVACATDRIPRGERVVLARSQCRACGRVLAPVELVPILSYAMLHGRCRSCRASIPLVAIGAELSALALATPLVLLPSIASAIGAVMAGPLLALSVFDAQHGRLPNLLTGLLALASICAIVAGLSDWRDCLVGGCLGFASLYLIAEGFRYFRGRDGLGRGDIKLFGALGLWVGWQGLPYILLLSSTLAFLFALAGGARLHPSSKIPFGPFICLTGYCTWFLQHLA